MQVIGVHGRICAGKDTFADRLVMEHGFLKRGFADPLYEEVADAFMVEVPWLHDRQNKEKAQHALRPAYCRDTGFYHLMTRQKHYGEYTQFSPRTILQLWGSDYRRHSQRNYWLDKMRDFIRDVNGVNGVVINDLRFENEADMVRSYEHGTVVQIIRPLTINAAAMGHVSEQPLHPDLIDFTIYNTSDIKALQDAADYYVLWAVTLKHHEAEGSWQT